jgi:hypothetical protein
MGEMKARRGVLAWMTALAVGWAALAALGYRSRDPDSRLYAEITARMSTAPPAGWIAPDFPPGWFMNGRFREHPAGLFVPAALLARLGYPADEAAYALNALYQALTLVLLPTLAAHLAPGLESRALGWLMQLLPIAFAYRARANHEQAVVLCLVMALLGTERSRRSPGWAALTAAGLVALLLVKGLFAVFGPLLCALWLLTARPSGEGPERCSRAAWAGLLAAVVAMGAAAALYEALYRRATGEPFWSVYLSRQLGVAAAFHPGGGMVAEALQKGSNLIWYAGRVLWFAFPWSLTLLAAAAPRWLLRRWEAPPGAAPGGPASAAGAAAFVAGATLLYLGVFSLADRRADRYIFPVYYLAGGAGAVVALRRWPRFRRVAAALDRPWVPAAIWCLALLLHPVAGRLGVPTIKLWPPRS